MFYSIDQFQLRSRGLQSQRYRAKNVILRASSKDNGPQQGNNQQPWSDNSQSNKNKLQASKQFDQLLDLAALNERLSGAAPWEIRSKIDHIKKITKNQELVYEYLVKSHADTTLKSLEDANQQVEKMLSEEYQDTKSLHDLQDQLQTLQSQIDDAHSRLHLTQARINQSLARVTDLKREAVQLEELQKIADMNANQVPQKRASRQDSGLASSLEIEQGLQEFWYPVTFSSKLKDGDILAIELFNTPIAIYRDSDGKPACVHDQCAHRACPLSEGTVVDGEIQCPYHGWQFNSQGTCTKMPSTPFMKNVGIDYMPTAEKDGMIWVWSGVTTPTPVPSFSQPPPNFTLHAEIEIEVPVEHGLLMENLLDLAHAPFTHTSTFAKGWPIPDAVRFHARRILSGNWDPYPIDMSFQPPCMVLSTIGLMQPGKIAGGARASQCTNHLFQLHVCLPSKTGHTRLLYRMALDFLGWVKYVPQIHRVWEYVASQVLGEDLVLVAGQQDRMQRGANTWNNPVAYDKLAVKYRRWRNKVGNGEVDGAEKTQSQTMSAGEMFVAYEDDIEEELEEGSDIGSAVSALGVGADDEELAVDEDSLVTSAAEKKRE